MNFKIRIFHLTRSVLILMCCLFSILTHADPVKTQPQKQSIVTAAQVNGTWRSGDNEFRVWALGQQKLRVEFSGVYAYKVGKDRMANIGEGAGIATIEGTTAIFKPDDIGDDACKITLKFSKGKLQVEQESICGFGHNVSASGTYRKVSSKKPKFQSPEK